MAYPDSFLKLTFGGTVANEDVWSNSFSLMTTVGGTAPIAFDNINPEDYASIATAFYRSTTNGMAQYNRLTYIKIALIGTDGKTIGEPKVYDYSTPIVGNYTGSVIPQASNVVSLTTDTIRGLANRGRIFLPAGFGDVEGTTGRLSTATATALATRAVTFLNGINSASMVEGVYSRLVIVSGVRTGAAHLVTGVEVGNLVDTQRRRRNRLAEVYVESSLTPV